MARRVGFGDAFVVGYGVRWVCLVGCTVLRWLLLVVPLSPVDFESSVPASVPSPTILSKDFGACVRTVALRECCDVHDKNYDDDADGARRTVHARRMNENTRGR